MIWAHRLWQKHGLRMEDFEKMPRQTKCAYIASEMVAEKFPVHSTDRLLRAFTKNKSVRVKNSKKKGVRYNSGY